MVNHNLLFDFDIGVFFILCEKVFESCVETIDGVDYLIVQGSYTLVNHSATIKRWKFLSFILKLISSDEFKGMLCPNSKCDEITNNFITKFSQNLLFLNSK